MTGDRTAGANLERSLAIYQDLGNLVGQATCLNNLGALAYLRGDWAGAVDKYREGQVVQLRSGDVTSAALGSANIGEVLSDQGHWDAALANLDEALGVWRSTGHRHGIAYAQGLRGRLLARQGDHVQALAELLAAEALHREVGAEGDAATVWLWQAECHLLADDPAAGIRTLDAGADDGAVTADRLRATCSWLMGEADSATQLLHAAYLRAVDEREPYEQVCIAEVLAHVDPSHSGADSRDAAEAAELGIVRLAVVPSS
jgi:tetratricopeptide (TPR) repeat protein